jgi:hypothetical protein
MLLNLYLYPPKPCPRRRFIVNTARVFLCTIDSSARMESELQEALASKEDEVLNLGIDTCIVDEAGCVLESSIPVLLRWNPANIVLVIGMAHSTVTILLTGPMVSNSAFLQTYF